MPTGHHSEDSADPPQLKEHVSFSKEALPDTTAPSSLIHYEDYVDACEECVNTTPQTLIATIAIATHRWKNMSDSGAIRTASLVSCVSPCREHILALQLAECLTDEELEQDLQYDFHCKEEYERSLLNRVVTIGAIIYPFDFCPRCSTLPR